MPESLNWLDIAVAVIFALFVIRGGWIGFIRQLAAFFALVGSYLIAGRYTTEILPYTEQFVDNPKLVFLASFVGLFLVSAVCISLLGRLLNILVEVIFLEWFNRLLGVLLGAFKAALITSLLYMVLASFLSPTGPPFDSSLCAPYLRQGAQILQNLINDPKLREYFKEYAPAIPKASLGGTTADEAGKRDAQMRGAALQDGGAGAAESGGPTASPAPAAPPQSN